MLKKVTASILAAVMLCCGFVFVGLAEESYADQIAEYFSDDPMVIRSKYSDTAVGENVSMVECGNKVYCFGWNSTQIYDTAANTWTSAPVMLSLRSEYSAVENGGKIYLVGGIIGNEVTDKVDIFDTETGTWSVGQEIPFGFVDGEAVSIGDNIYCFGGYDDVNHSVKSRDTYIYDTVNQTWSYVVIFLMEECIRELLWEAKYTALQNTVEMAIIHTYMIQVIMYGQSGRYAQAIVTVLFRIKKVN